MTVKNNNIADGQYVFTVNDYNLIQGHMGQIQDHMRQINEILARSRVTGKVRESAGNRAVAPVAEKLNDTVVKNLIGHTNVVYYNFETYAWNTNTYNGYTIGKQDIDTEHAHAFKVAMEKMPEFNTQYEMVASVTMTIDSKFYPGWKNTISTPRYSNKGTAVVGNIIVKNKTTGKYELYCKSWVGGNDCDNPAVAVFCGANGFAGDGDRGSGFRAALMRAHTR